MLRDVLYQHLQGIKQISKYLFANEKKIYNEIKYITEIKYINFVNWVNQTIKSISGLFNMSKGKTKHFCCWQGDTIHAYKSFYLHCDPSTKVPSKLKSEVSY